MKKSVKVLAIIMSLALILTGTSVVCFAEGSTNDAIGQAFSEWMTALSKFTIDDFYGFISGILRLFGINADFEGSHSMAEIADQIFNNFGSLGKIYEGFVNAIDTTGLVQLINTILASTRK